MADANDPSKTPPVNQTEDDVAKAAKAAEEKAAAEKAQADKKAQAEADKKAADEKKAADKAEKETAKAKADEEAAKAAEDEKPKQRVVNDPTLNNRGGRGSDIQVLIDAMPDEIYDVFVAPHNLDSRGVDEETGFDLRKITNPTLDGLRLRLREQGFNV